MYNHRNSWEDITWQKNLYFMILFLKFLNKVLSGSIYKLFLQKTLFWVGYQKIGCTATFCLLKVVVRNRWIMWKKGSNAVPAPEQYIPAFRLSAFLPSLRHSILPFCIASFSSFFLSFFWMTGERLLSKPV